MNRVAIQQVASAQLQGVVAPVELIDESGQLLGHFIPRSATVAGEPCPYSPEELQAMRAEDGGRPLETIWKSLEAE